MSTHSSALQRLVMPIVAAAIALVGQAGRTADQPIADPAYAFAQQKIYGMTLTAIPSGTGPNAATLVGSGFGFGVKMSTAASVDSLPGVGAHVGGLDALQTFVGGTSPLPPVENYSDNVPVGYGFPAGERVLIQLNKTGTGVPNGITNGIPVLGDFTVGHNFARADAYVTPNPNITPTGTASGTTPANVPPGVWPPNGALVPSGHLFAPIGSPDTLSIDVVAETLLTDVAHGSISNGIADWSVTGKFAIVGANSDARVGVSLDFNVIERMAVFSSEPLTNIAVASNEFSFEVLDSQGTSVFGGLLGSNPSISRLLSSPATGSDTYNNNTNVPTHIYPGPGATTFQTAPLPPGDYSFTIKGTSTAYVSLLPEPSMNAAIAIVAAGAAACLRRRRRPPQPTVDAPQS